MDLLFNKIINRAKKNEMSNQFPIGRITGAKIKKNIIKNLIINFLKDNEDSHNINLSFHQYF